MGGRDTMRPWAFAALSLAAALAAGCASAGSGGSYREPGTVSVVTPDGTFQIPMGADVRAVPTVAVSAGDAWSALPGVYQALGIETDVMEPARRRIGATQHRFSGQILRRSPSEFFDCGTDPGLTVPLADRAPINAQVITEVVGSGDGAEIRTSVSGTARRPGGAAGVAQCRSLGLLEILIARMAEERAKPGTGDAPSPPGPGT